jgi:hypothetical protein
VGSKTNGSTKSATHLPQSWHFLLLPPRSKRSFDSIERILNNSDSMFAFPRYMKGSRCNSNSASATFNKWLRPMLPDNCVIHSFRHSFRDRLREAEAPTEITNTLGGWASKSVGQKYGTGFQLNVLAKWMHKIA